MNGGATIGDTLLFLLFNLAKAILEQRRPWVILRSTDTSKTVATSNSWQRVEERCREKGYTFPPDVHEV